MLNEGIDWSYGGNVYWKHDVKRSEVLQIILHGNAEFEATDVVLQVNFLFKILDACRKYNTTDTLGLTVSSQVIKKSCHLIHTDLLVIDMHSKMAKTYYLLQKNMTF